MKIDGSVALVTGANRGLGRVFARMLVSRGAAKVYGIVNMLSVTSFYTNPFDASYGASKAAAWSLTNGVRLELHHQGTLVVAVHASFIPIQEFWDVGVQGTP